MRVGPYEVTGELGRGGAGVVYRARTADGREVAIKVLGRFENAAARARFDRERRLLASLGESEGFVPLLDAGEVHAAPFIVMPLVPGGTLRARLGPGRALGIEETVALGIRLARSLGRAHERGIIHRDLKPENILFDARGEPLVADLGLAKHFRPEGAPGGSVSLSRSRELRGTPGYMAPEQMGDAKHAGPAADVFSLGVILYECLAGRRPWEGSPIQVVERTVTSAAEPLARPDAPAWLVHVIEKAIARDPGRRFPDAGALAHALAARKGPRRRGRSAAVAAAALVLVAGTVLGLALRTPPLPVAAMPAPATTPAHVPPAPPAADTASGAEALVARARAEHAKGDPKTALATVRRAEELAPELVEAWRLESEILRALGDGTRAIAAAQRAIELDPRNARAWTDLAQGHLMVDPAAALEDANKAIELDPGLAFAYYVRAFLRANGKLYRDALAEIERAIELDPAKPSYFELRGMVRGFLEDRGALADFTHALELDPRFVTALVDRAKFERSWGDGRAAVEDLTRAIELEPGSAAHYEERGNARVGAGDRPGGIADLDHAVELDPGRASAWLARGLSREAGGKGDRDGAIGDYSRAIEADPRSAAAWVARGTAYVGQGALAAARADLDRGIELDPKNMMALASRSHVRQALGDPEGAVGDATRALEVDPGSAPTYLYRALARHDLHDVAGAVADLDRALVSDPRFGEAHRLRALARRELGDTKGALADFEAFLELSPAAPEAASVRAAVAKLKAER